jgi:Permuted papain-like amidase enzyme, YaeF/YiiX, C92 family
VQMIFLQNTNLRYIKRWLCGCLFFLLLGCGGVSSNELVILKNDSLKELQKIERAFIKIDSAQQIIATGDLIVRSGSDFTSESLRSLNQRDKTYSHCGIASIENDSVFVYHALGGEFNPDQKIRKDKFEVFAEPYTNRGIGIYRYQLLQIEINNLMLTVKKLHEMGIMFDMKFNLQSNDRMYCAEFVYKAYVMGTKGKLQFNTSHIDKFAFIGVDDLFLHPLCKEQKKILYQ